MLLRNHRLFYGSSEKGQRFSARLIAFRGTRRNPPSLDVLGIHSAKALLPRCTRLQYGLIPVNSVTARPNPCPFAGSGDSTAGSLFARRARLRFGEIPVNPVGMGLHRHIPFQLRTVALVRYHRSV